MNPDVLVVGAGPSGLAAAAELALHGAKVRLVEARSDRAGQSRAIVVQPRTLELFDRRGLAAELRLRAFRSNQVLRHAPGHPPVAVRLDTGISDSRFPGLLWVPQNETEDVLTQHLHNLGVRVERQTELTGLRQESEHVTATLQHADGSSEQVRAQYLIGADGVHSAVRRLAGISFEGGTYEQSFLVADLHVDGLPDAESLHLFARGRAIATFMPLRHPAPWRLLLVELDNPGDQQPTLADLERQSWIWEQLPLLLHDPIWVSRFQAHHRMAAHFRQGRVFLAGDAAHVHSPAGGQGMNTGLQDAWNLGWKLALVSTGHARAELLDSYEAERMAVARELLRTTDRLFAGMVSANPLIRAARATLFPFLTSVAGRNPRIGKRAAQLTSMLRIAYPDSPIVAGSAERLRPRPGERLPDLKLPDGGWLHERLTGPGHHLLLCRSYDDNEIGQLLRTYDGLITLSRVPDGTLGGGAVLVRPDGYVAFRGGDDLAPLKAYLARWLLPSVRA
ncbi:FAD-dependent monooxygenase [Nonomuraea sp. B5E05]|uniref:FAD-dependent monooxygenase n=1 Tax=Nonomuraea sp. B5E05 TaxID=3153569 RepID=UPI0032616706